MTYWFPRNGRRVGTFVAALRPSHLRPSSDVVRFDGLVKWPSRDFAGPRRTRPFAKLEDVLAVDRQLEVITELPIEEFGEFEATSLNRLATSEVVETSTYPEMAYKMTVKQRTQMSFDTIFQILAESKLQKGRL